VVFNANYLTYFDIGVVEWFRAIGVPYPAGLAQHGMDTFARKAEVEFHSPAHYDDSLAIGARAARLGRTSLNVLFAIYRDDTLIVSGALTYVNVDLSTKKPVPLPEFLLEAIRRYERVPPEQG
jgi:acyl-CoA thioester hydrolase